MNGTLKYVCNYSRPLAAYGREESKGTKSMTTQEHQPSEDTMREKSLEVMHTVEKDMKPYEQLLIKCKDDWIHHLAQALAFSFLTTLASIATLLSIFDVIVRKLDTQVHHMLIV